ncbi:MAG: DNA polymerase III subunit chi [Gammaproteobacteria bacterium]
MTTRVDFYLIPEPTMEARQLFACRLIDKAYRQGHRIYFYVLPESAQSVDDHLWTFKDTSFVPHSMDKNNNTLPVLIGHTAPPAEWTDLLVNITPNIPDFFAQFQRIVEIVPNEPAWRERARQHYRQYRQKGCELESHELE